VTFLRREFRQQLLNRHEGIAHLLHNGGVRLRNQVERLVDRFDRAAPPGTVTGWLSPMVTVTLPFASGVLTVAG
jgi:hypothetical protein